MAQRAIIKLAFGHQADSFLSASHKSVSQEVVLPLKLKSLEKKKLLFLWLLHLGGQVATKWSALGDVCINPTAEGG